MKKAMLSFIALALLSAGTCYADIFKPIGAPEKLKATEQIAIPGVSPDMLLGTLTQILGYLGPKDGPLLDKHGTTNYASATVVTYDPAGLALNIGETGDNPVKPDGGALVLDWNAGKYIPAANVPLMQYIQQATIGGGVDYRKTVKSDSDPTERWNASWCLVAQVKGTF